MQPSPAIPASTQATAPSAPRAQRSNNRKSGLPQSQSQSQAINQSQTQRFNNSGNIPRQTHARHQSMPPQQRNANYTKPDMSTVSILKRSSATPAPKDSSPPVVDVLTPLPADNGLYKQQQQHQQQQQYRSNQKPRPQSQQQQPPSKARRVQRRKDIDTMTESLSQVDIDLALHQSPPLDPSSPPSSSDSDDSESAMSCFPDRRFRQLAASPKQQPSPAPTVLPQSRRGHLNVDTKLLQADVYPSRASLIQVMQRPNVHTAKTHSADKVMLAERTPTSARYAGPTFHNSPAPDTLPIPTFARSAGNSPIEPSMEKLPSAPFFAEAASPQLNSMRPLAMQSPAPGWYGHHSMPMAVNYNVPDRMATSSFTPHVSGPYNVDLMEISQNLRMLLKIGGSQ
ncbi:hypothetical protein BGZ65_007295 [Modicella reniformis]|uniref:Uncharacterized protein n=1 Tax=Modicella reniformis TaxID=1440133 RepID=A0A9P6J5K3_9FUNG|nr:hypothetical protein BGZ65_007295 [Modicella reniformis]